MMIAVDDLRPTIGAYGDQLVKTPNIDKLASEGMVFLNSFCNIPVCGSSRASILTSTRPTRYRFLTYYAQSDVEVPNAIAINEHFKENGYKTISNGKIFHMLKDRAGGWDDNWRIKNEKSAHDYQLSENIALDQNGSRGLPYENADVHDTIYKDGKLMLKTVNDLKKLKASGEPFFLAAGFVKPHLPFNAPSKYWEMYDRSDFEPSIRKFWPENAPKEAFHTSGELRNYSGVPKEGFVSDSLSVTLQHGYHAATSYADAQIGLILEELDRLGLRDNTIVVLWGDHGWQLGEHGMWNKHCNFNTSLSAPLIISAPGMEKGLKTSAMVEFIDIYPTISELAGLSIPETVEGKSLVPLLEDPEKPWSEFIISKYQDGLTIRTAQYAYTEFRDNEDNLLSKMLYDHNRDPFESNNLASQAEFDGIMEDLQTKMIENRGPNYFKPLP